MTHTGEYVSFSELVMEYFKDIEYKEELKETASSDIARVEDVKSTVANEVYARPNFTDVIEKSKKSHGEKIKQVDVEKQKKTVYKDTNLDPRHHTAELLKAHNNDKRMYLDADSHVKDEVDDDSDDIKHNIIKTFKDEVDTYTKDKK